MGCEKEGDQWELGSKEVRDVGLRGVKKRNKPPFKRSEEKKWDVLISLSPND